MFGVSEWYHPGILEGFDVPVVLYQLESLARMCFSWWRRKFTYLQADVFLQAWPLEARNFEFLLNLVNVLSWRYIYSVFNKLVGNNVSDEIEKKNHSVKLCLVFPLENWQLTTTLFVKKSSKQETEVSSICTKLMV